MRGKGEAYGLLRQGGGSAGSSRHHWKRLDHRQHWVRITSAMMVLRVFAVTLSVAASVQSDHSSAGTPDGMSASYDCEARKHAWEFGKTTLPRHRQFKTLFDAMQLQHCKGVAAPSTTDDAFVPPRFPTPIDGHVLYADAKASVGGDGTRARPFATLEAALAAATSVPNTTVLLREGRFHTAGVVLTSAHSGLTIQNYEGESVVVSGTVAVPTSAQDWSLHNKKTNTWKLDLSSAEGMPSQAFGMRVGSRRATLARFPNGDAEAGGEADPRSGLSTEPLAAFSRTHDPVNETVVVYSNPEDWPGVFWMQEAEGGNLPVAGANVAGTGHWYDSHGGRCSGRQAPYGFWCSADNPRSQLPSDPQVPYSMPGGFKLDLAKPDQARAANWSNPRGAIYHIRSNFFSIQCLVDGIESDGTVNFNRSVGCDQGGPSPWGGSPGIPGSAISEPGSWYVEGNVEDCDVPGEYFYDAHGQALFYTFNTSSSPKGDEDFSLTVAKVIFNISGTQEAPVRDVTIRGLTIRDAAYTFLGTTAADIHYIPSASDWTIQRSGAILLEGTEGFILDSNEITRCDGNGVFLSNYNRRTLIASNDFTWLGDNAMSAFGSMDRCLYANCSVRLEWPSGVDGRAGNQPRDTRVVGNFVHELGIYQKQSGAWAQHLVAATHLESNVFINGPHSAVDFNDGFGGNDRVIGNLMANFNRQTRAHGVINQWERAPYISDIGMVRNYSKAAFNTTDEMPTLQQLEGGYSPAYSPAPPGVGSVVSPFRRVHNNVLIANYQSLSAVTLDDGGSRMLQYNNYIIYGAWGVGESCHNSQWVYGVNNMYAYATSGYGAPQALIASEGPSPLGIRTFFYDNTILLDKDDMWCKAEERTHLNLTVFSNNAVHTPSGGNGSATGNVCVPPGASRPACGHPPYRPSAGCTQAQGCCFDPSHSGRNWCYPRVNSSSCANKCHISLPAAGLFPRCKGSGNKVSGPMPDAEVTDQAKRILAPYPRAVSKTDDMEAMMS